MNQTIILPIVNTVEKNCIIQNGTRYCEDQPVSPLVLGWSIIGTIALMAYIFLLLWIDDRLDKSPIFFLFGITMPLIIIGVALILL